MKFYLTYLLLLLFSFSNAQDIIYKTDGSTISSKILSVENTEVRYKKYSNPEGPTYIIYTRDIDKIIYENGYEEFFNIKETQKQNEPEQPDGNKEKYDYSKYRNSVQFNIFDIVYNEFTLSYEYLTKKRKLGIEIPVSLGYNLTDPVFQDASVFYSGIALNVYPAGFKKITYFTGPELRIGQTSTTRWDSEKQKEVTDKKFLYSRFLVNNGIAFNLAENFFLATHVGIGIKYYDIGIDEDKPAGIHSNLNFTFTMATRF